MTNQYLQKYIDNDHGNNLKVSWLALKTVYADIKKQVDDFLSSDLEEICLEIRDLKAGEGSFKEHHVFGNHSTPDNRSLIRYMVTHYLTVELAKVAPGGGKISPFIVHEKVQLGGEGFFPVVMFKKDIEAYIKSPYLYSLLSKNIPEAAVKSVTYNGDGITVELDLSFTEHEAMKEMASALLSHDWNIEYYPNPEEDDKLFLGLYPKM